MGARALLQGVPDAYRDATRGALGFADEPIVLARARAQHQQVVQAMQWLGYQPTVLGPDGAGPDAIFVEDPVVVGRDRAWLTRSAHPGRAGEGERLANPLRAWGLRVERQTAGTLDGGDVLVVGDTAFVGLSGRTDRAGAQAFAQAFPWLRVHAVPLPPGGLHLKCEASPLGDGRVLATGRMGAALGIAVVEVPEAEAYAANAVARGGRVLIPAGFPRTHEALDRAGFEVRALDTTEMRKGDGSLTCLSVRLEA